MPLYLGVDGGGTKTAFVLMDGDRRVVAESTGPTGYALGTADGVQRLEAVLRAGIADVLAAAGAAPEALTSAFFALPAYGESSALQQRLDALPARLLDGVRSGIGNDMVAGWAGSLDGRDGVNVVAGTGSIAYGEWRGRSVRTGGWGETFGDEGSAYWIAVQGLNAYSRMADGRAPEGPLLPLLRDALGVRVDLEAVGVVIEEWRADRGRIAALAPVIVEAAEAGDAVAQGVVERAGLELAALVTAACRLLGVRADERPPVSWSGGVFRSAAVTSAFRAALGDRVALQAPLHGPGIGAAIAAERLAQR